MKKIVLIYILLNSCLIFSQVGIGTTTPEASLHIKNINIDKVLPIPNDLICNEFPNF